MNFKKPQNSFETIRAASFHSLSITQEKTVMKKILKIHLTSWEIFGRYIMKEEKPFDKNNKERGRGGEESQQAIPNYNSHSLILSWS